MKEDAYKLLYSELEKYENFGVSMTLDDYPASPMQIVSALMVREDSNYMRDYVWDDAGQVKKLAFYNIKKSE